MTESLTLATTRLKNLVIMYNKTLTNNNEREVEEIVVKLDTDSLAKSLYYRDEGNVSDIANTKQDAININLKWHPLCPFQMNIVISLFAHEHEEKRVIRFKKIAADDISSNLSCDLFTLISKEDIWIKAAMKLLKLPEAPTSAYSAPISGLQVSVECNLATLKFVFHRTAHGANLCAH